MNDDASRSPERLGELLQVREHMDAALTILDRLDELMLAALLSDTLDRLDKRIQSPA
jgi:hypothetical protein